MTNSLDDFSNGGNYLVGSQKMHTVISINNDLLALGREKGKLCLTVFAFSFQLVRGKVEIVPVSSLRSRQHHEKNSSQGPFLRRTTPVREILSRPLALAVFGI